MILSWSSPFYYMQKALVAKKREGGGTCLRLIINKLKKKKKTSILKEGKSALRRHEHRSIKAPKKNHSREQTVKWEKEADKKKPI